MKASSFDHGNVLSPELCRALERMIQCLFLRLVPSLLRHFRVHLASTLCPPDVTHVMNETRSSPFFPLFRFRVLYWTQTKEQKTGEAWERGYVRSLTLCLINSTSPNSCREYRQQVSMVLASFPGSRAWATREPGNEASMVPVWQLLTLASL